MALKEATTAIQQSRARMLQMSNSSANCKPVGPGRDLTGWEKLGTRQLSIECLSRGLWEALLARLISTSNNGKLPPHLQRHNLVGMFYLRFIKVLNHRGLKQLSCTGGLCLPRFCS